MRTFVLGFPLWAVRREEGWLAEDNGQGRLKAGPRSPFPSSPPVRPASHCSVASCVLLFKISATLPSLGPVMIQCNRRGGVWRLVPGTHRRLFFVEVQSGPNGSATGGTATNALVVGPAPAHSRGPHSPVTPPSRPQ